MKTKFVRLTNCQSQKNRKYIGQLAKVMKENCTSADGHFCYKVITADGVWHYWAIGNFKELKPSESENLLLFRKSA